MPSTIGWCKLFRIKHFTLLEGETFLRNKHEIAFFKIKCTFFGRKENIIRSGCHSVFERLTCDQQIGYPLINVLNLSDSLVAKYRCLIQNVNTLDFNHGFRFVFVVLQLVHLRSGCHSVCERLTCDHIARRQRSTFFGIKFCGLGTFIQITAICCCNS